MKLKALTRVAFFGIEISIDVTTNCCGMGSVFFEMLRIGLTLKGCNTRRDELVPNRMPH